MQVFNLVLTQMLMMFSLMAVGFLLRKFNILPEKSDIAISKLETFLFVPSLNFYTQLTNCNVQNFLENSKFMIYGLLIIIVAIALSYPLSRLFFKKLDTDALKYQRNIYKYALTFGNYGFIGNFIVLGVWGEEMFFKYSMFTFFVSLFCTVWGLYILIPKESGNSLVANLKKGLITPPTISLVLGMICGLLNLKQYFPEFVLSALVEAKSCMGPAAMVLAGIVIGGFKFKDMLLNRKVYIATFLRLIVIPSVFVLVLKLLGANSDLLTFTLVAFATPLGMNTIVYPAAYGGDTKTGASMTMISSVLAIITMPLLFMIFINI